MKTITVLSAVPYQCCPVCNGTGNVLADGFISSVYQTCKVCNGAMIIPMHSQERPVECQTESDAAEIARQYINHPSRQLIIDKPQDNDPTKACHLPKHLLKDAGGNVIGYWEYDMHYYENGIISGFYPPVFLPVMPYGTKWIFDMVSGKFYIG